MYVEESRGISFHVWSESIVSCTALAWDRTAGQATKQNSTASSCSRVCESLNVAGLDVGDTHFQQRIPGFRYEGFPMGQYCSGYVSQSADQLLPATSIKAKTLLMP